MRNVLVVIVRMQLLHCGVGLCVGRRIVRRAYRIGDRRVRVHEKTGAGDTDTSYLGANGEVFTDYGMKSSSIATYLEQAAGTAQ